MNATLRIAVRPCGTYAATVAWRHVAELAGVEGVMPLVVIEALIVRCSLDESGAVKRQEADLVHVWANGISGTPQRVYVLKSRLPTFAQALADLAHVAASSDSTN